MKLALSIFLIIIFSEVSEHFFPWWSIAVVAFGVSLMNSLEPKKAFFAGFISIFLFWFIIILFKDFHNEHILSMKMTKLLGAFHPIILVLITALLGGIIGGLASLSGSFFRKKQEDY